MMAVRLCLQGVGRCARPEDLLKRMTAADVALYQAYDRQHPFGSDATHRLLAHLAAIFFNSKRKETAQPFTAESLLPWYIPPEQTADEIFAAIRSVTRGHRSEH